MKLRNLILLCLASGVIVSCQNSSSTAKIESQLDSISYLMGASDGERLIGTFERERFDTLLNLELYFEGLVDASNEKELVYDLEADGEKVKAFFGEYREGKTRVMQDSTKTALPYLPLKETVDSISYLMGAGDGKGLLEGFASAGLDTIVVFDLYLSGIQATGKGGESIIPVEENMPMVQKFFTELQEQRLSSEFGSVKAEGEAYLAENQAKSEVTATASGLQYEILVEGNGPKPTAADKVKVHYHGTLVDGTVFDSSVDRGEPATFGVGQVIKGWTEALQLMPVGSKWKLAIPYDLAYGTRPRQGGAIRPYDALVFEVELLEIVK